MGNYLCCLSTNHRPVDLQLNYPSTALFNNSVTDILNMAIRQSTLTNTVKVTGQHMLSVVTKLKITVGEAAFLDGTMWMMLLRDQDPSATLGAIEILYNLEKQLEISVARHAMVYRIKQYGRQHGQTLRDVINLFSNEHRFVELGIPVSTLNRKVDDILNMEGFWKIHYYGFDKTIRCNPVFALVILYCNLCKHLINVCNEPDGDELVLH